MSKFKLNVACFGVPESNVNQNTSQSNVTQNQTISNLGHSKAEQESSNVVVLIVAIVEPIVIIAIFLIVLLCYRRCRKDKEKSQLATYGRT